MNTRRCLLLLFSFFVLHLSTLSLSAEAKLEVLAKDLQAKDLDEMEGLVREALDRYKKTLKEDRSDSGEQAAIENLRQITQVILSRPNPDDMIHKVFEPVESELRRMNAYADTLLSLASESLQALTVDRHSPETKNTHFVILENMVAEFRAELRKSRDLVPLFERIRDAKVKAPAEVRKLRRKTMQRITSPSDLATEALKAMPSEPNKNEKKGS